MGNLINWFEIPATDLKRASEFYKKVLGGDLHQQEMMGIKMAFLPMDGEGVGGALCQGDGYTPSQESSILYLNGGEDLSEPLSKVESAGGKIIMEKSKISDEIGFMAIFLDTEGNRMAFHSPK